MRPRQQIIEIFSTFLVLNASSSNDWVKDRILYENMQRNLGVSGAEKGSSQYWAVFWHKHWEQQLLAKRHLYAYLQEASYKAAQNINARLSLKQYTLADYFSLAFVKADKVLTGFNPTRSSNLGAYAYVKFSNLIKDGLIKEGLQEANIRSDWSLLKNTSQKRLRESLKLAGYSQDTIESYVLAWECFNEVYAIDKPQGNRQLTAPDASTWEAIAKLNGNSQSAATLEKWMNGCIKAIRAYNNPPTISLDQPISEQGSQFGDTIASSELSPLEKLEESDSQQQRKTLYQQANSLLEKAIASSDSQIQQILVMHYGEGLTQTEIGKKLQLSQPTVSRRFTKLNKQKQQWIEILVRWAILTLNISITPDVIKNVSHYLEEWLEFRYSNNPSTED